MLTLKQDKMILTDPNGAATNTFEIISDDQVLSIWEDENGSLGEEIISYEQARQEVDDLIQLCWS